MIDTDADADPDVNTTDNGSDKYELITTEGTTATPHVLKKTSP